MSDVFFGAEGWEGGVCGVERGASVFVCACVNVNQVKAVTNSIFPRREIL